MNNFPKNRFSVALISSLTIFLSACGSSPSGTQPSATNPTASFRSGATVVVSGVDNYWQPGTLKTVDKPANSEESNVVNIDTSQTFQTWHGLGGTFNEAGWQALQYLTESERKTIMQALFNKKNGAGFEWGRIPIGASDYALTRYTLNDNAGDIDMSEFSIDHDRQWLIPYIKAAQAVKNDIHFWGSPWTPPAWMKDNKSFDGGAFDPQYYEPYAKYLVKWVQAYNNEGIAIDHVQPQNEPGWAQAYPSCGWGPSIADGVSTDREVTLSTFVEDYLSPAMEKAQPETDIWYGTLSNGRTFDTYWDALSAKGRAKIKGVGLQWGTSKHVGELAHTKGKDGQFLLVMQTEHMCGNYPWLQPRATSPLDANHTNFLPNIAPNNHAYAEESWGRITRWIEEGVHIYSAWNMVLDTGGFNLDKARPWPQNALIAVDTEKKTYRLTPAYYVFRHIGQFVQPQAKRVALTGGNGLAFLNPDDTLVVVLHNAEESVESITLAVDGETLAVEVPAKGWASVKL